MSDNNQIIDNQLQNPQNLQNNNTSDQIQQNSENLQQNQLQQANNVEQQKNNNPDQQNQQANNNNQQIAQKAKKRVTLEDFEYIGSIGKGAYGEVVLVKKIGSGLEFAMKALEKNFLQKEKKQYQVQIEKYVLMNLSHPGVVKLYYSFQDQYKLYFVMEYCEGGEFSDFLRQNKSNLDYNAIKFYTAEIVTILEYLHTNGIAHRDIKPENLILSSSGHIKVIDFGTAYIFDKEKVDQEFYQLLQKIKSAEKQKDAQLIDEDVISSYQSKHRATFVGTPEYVSPELLEDDTCEAPADLWALGCIIYKMFTGQTPFKENTEYLIFQKIKQNDIKMNNQIPEEAQDLILQLLNRYPEKRLGCGKKGSSNDYEALKNHPFFKGIDFDTLFQQKPPLSITKKQIKKYNKKVIDDDNPFLKQILNQDNSDDELEEQQQIAQQQLKQSIMGPEDVILQGLNQKKCGLIFYKPRLLILKKNGKIEYYCPKTNIKKGEIPLAPDVKALHNGKKWQIKLPYRTYYFKQMDQSAKFWVDTINNTIKEKFKS